MKRVHIVVPCFNEARRLQVSTFAEFIRGQSRLRFLFVDDGSTDETLCRLRELHGACGEYAQILESKQNLGKAEAVRTGMLAVLKSDPQYVGYWDADLATPLGAILEFCALLDEQPNLEIVLGSRVKLLGRDIKRQAIRHYIGRCFATVASLALGIGVYDTQCGAKLFRVTPTLRGIFEQPFVGSWVFDVEILARFVKARPAADKQIYELPLRAWSDVKGSKVKTRHAVRAGLDLVRIFHRYRFLR